MSLARTTHNAAAPSIGYVPPSPDIQALISARCDGLPVWRRDLTSDRVAAIREQIRRVDAALAPASAARIASWLKRLGEHVTNPPADGEEAAKAASIVIGVCGDLPAQVWSQRAVLAWVRQPARNGFPVGSRWPSVAELHAHLSALAEPLRREAWSLQALLAIADAPAEPERRRPSEEERRTVAEMMAARNAEVAARQAEDERNRKHGGHTPEGAEGLKGRALADALRRALPAMTGDLAAVTRERIEMLERAADMAEALRG